MKMTLRDVNQHFEELRAVNGLTLPAKLRYALACNIEKLQAEVKRIADTREELLKQYAEKDENGEPVKKDAAIGKQKVQEYVLTPENMKQYTKEYGEFLNDDVDIEIRTVKTEVLEECEEKDRYSIPNVAQQLAMSFMLEE